jgi:hypothetical protein
MAITNNKHLAYGYFSQTLLPDYIEEKGVSWNSTTHADKPRVRSCRSPRKACLPRPRGAPLASRHIATLPRDAAFWPNPERIFIHQREVRACCDQKNAAANIQSAAITKPNCFTPQSNGLPKRPNHFVLRSPRTISSVTAAVSGKPNDCRNLVNRSNATKCCIRHLVSPGKGRSVATHR